MSNVIVVSLNAPERMLLMRIVKDATKGHGSREDGQRMKETYEAIGIRDHEAKLFFAEVINSDNGQTIRFTGIGIERTKIRLLQKTAAFIERSLAEADKAKSLPILERAYFTLIEQWESRAPEADEPEPRQPGIDADIVTSEK